MYNFNKKFYIVYDFFFINLYLVSFTYVYCIKIYVSRIFLLFDIISFFIKLTNLLKNFTRDWLQ